MAVNMWGTDRAMVTAEEFCPGCEREVPGHYEGCPDRGVRLMGQHERDGWNMALWIAHVHRADRERLFDRLCELANEAEVKSIRYEQRGYADLAVDRWLLSELFDAAAAGLVR